MNIKLTKSLTVYVDLHQTWKTRYPVDNQAIYSYKDPLHGDQTKGDLRLLDAGLSFYRVGNFFLSLFAGVTLLNVTLQLGVVYDNEEKKPTAKPDECSPGHCIGHSTDSAVDVITINTGGLTDENKHDLKEIADGAAEIMRSQLWKGQAVLEKGADKVESEIGKVTAETKAAILSEVDKGFENAKALLTKVEDKL